MQHQPFFRKLKEYYHQFDRQERAVIDPLFEVKGEEIDDEEATIEENEGFVKIKLVSRGEECYPLSIWIGKANNKHRIFLFFGTGGSHGQIEVLSYEDFSSEDGVADAKITINDVLRSRIRRRDIVVAGELAKSIITSSAFRFSDGEWVPFVHTVKRVTIWGHKESFDAEYRAWVEAS